MHGTGRVNFSPKSEFPSNLTHFVSMCLFSFSLLTNNVPNGQTCFQNLSAFPARFLKCFKVCLTNLRRYALKCLCFIVRAPPPLPFLKGGGVNFNYLPWRGGVYSGDMKNDVIRCTLKNFKKGVEVWCRGRSS